MSGTPPSHATPRAQPVAEAPVEALLARLDELVRGWAAALILARPLERVAEVPLQSISRDGPVVCAQAIRALASDAELEHLRAGRAGGGREGSASPRELWALAGAPDGAGVVEAVEAFRGVLWEALLDELRRPLFDPSRARLTGDLGDRLAYVCASVLATTLAAPAADFAAPGSAADAPAGEGRGVAASAASAPAVGAPTRAAPPLGGPVLIDEREEPSAGDRAARDGAAGDPSLPRRTPSAGSGEDVFPLPWDTERATGELPQTAAEPEIQIRDERRDEGPSAWIGSIGRELARFERDQLPFAVLLVELGDLERLRRAALPAGVSSLMSQVERVLGEGLQLIAVSGEIGARPPGSFTRERPGRYWLLAPQTDAFAARRLAAWLARALKPLSSRRWAPEVTIGTAICPDDGRSAAVLAAHADAALSVV